MRSSKTGFLAAAATALALGAATLAQPAVQTIDRRSFNHRMQQRAKGDRGYPGDKLRRKAMNRKLGIAVLR